MNPVIKQIYESGVVEDAQGKSFPVRPWGIPFESGVVLYNLIRACKPGRTLETGMAFGMSTLFICQALRDNGSGQHTAIDPYEESSYSSIGLLNIERAGLRELLRFYPSTAAEVLPRLLLEEERLDFAFIDGRHLFDWALLDFFYIDKMLRVGGHIVFDDLWMPGIRKAVSFILRNTSYRLGYPVSRPCVPAWKHFLRFGRRMIQNPFGLDWKLKLIPENIAILRKVADDERKWNFHRAF
jgi:predicted O-methyltransferase YrrM